MALFFLWNELSVVGTNVDSKFSTLPKTFNEKKTKFLIKN